MAKLLQTLGRAHLWKGATLALIVAVVGSVVVEPPKAHAGGAIMVGFTIVTGGKDRVSGQTYSAFPEGGTALPTLDVISEALSAADLRRYLPSASVIRAYPGDSVRFTGIVWNVDPFPIPGYANLAVLQKDFNDPLNPLNPIQYMFRPDANVFNTGVFTVGTGLPVVPYLSNYVLRPSAVTLSSSAKPGQQLCQFVQTIPMFYLGYIPVIPYFEWKIPDLLNINLGFNGGSLTGSYTDGHGGSYGVDIGASGGSVIGSNGQTYETHDTWNVQFGRMMSCAEIAYVYDLEPTLTLDEAGSTATTMNVVPAVSEGDYKQLQPDAPAATDTQKTEWQISQLLVPDTGTPPTGFTQFANDRYLTASNKVCKFFDATYHYACTPLQQSTSDIFGDRKNTIFSSGARGDPLTIKSGSQFPTSVSAPAVIPSGFKLCYVLSVNSHRPVYPEWNSQWRNSPVVCSTRSADKKPKVQVLGDDVRVGGKISTSLTSLLSQIFGSWGQYASYSVGNVTGFASASGIKGGRPDPTDQSAYSALTFANAGGTFGKFSTSSANVNSKGVTGVKNYFSSLSSRPLTSPVNLSSLASSNKPYFYNTTGNLEINGATIDKGKTIIIVATGKVTIKSDINYTTDSLASIDDIPQVIIVAKDIDIDEGVKNIDAWLIADGNSGVINTCAQVPNTADLTVSKCINPLTVNGPVVTNRLLLHRTNGSGGGVPATLEEPAEIFRNRGDSYLWAWNYVKGSNNLTSTKQTELPPRF